MVLPLLGGATIIARCPLASGQIRSIILVSILALRLRRSVGWAEGRLVNDGARLSLLALLGSYSDMKLRCVDVDRCYESVTYTKIMRITIGVHRFEL